MNYLPLMGGTTTGNIKITKPGDLPSLTLDAPAGTTRAIAFETAGKTRWLISATGSPESGANAGSDFLIGRYNDAGSLINDILGVVRSTGQLYFNNLVKITTSNSVPSLDIEDAGAQGGCLRLIAAGVGNKTIRCDRSSNFAVLNAAFTTDILNVSDIGVARCSSGWGCRAGANGAAGSNNFNFNWVTSVLQVWVDNVNLGNISVTSDERVKQAIEPLALDSEAFAAIQPVKFRWADVSIFKDDGRDHWGFSVQNLMSLMPEAVVGDIEAKQANGDPQPASLDTLAILAQTVLQVQALMQRVQALETAGTS